MKSVKFRKKREKKNAVVTQLRHFCFGRGRRSRKGLWHFRILLYLAKTIVNTRNFNKLKQAYYPAFCRNNGQIKDKNQRHIPVFTEAFQFIKIIIKDRIFFCLTAVPVRYPGRLFYLNTVARTNPPSRLYSHSRADSSCSLPRKRIVALLYIILLIIIQIILYGRQIEKGLFHESEWEKQMKSVDAECVLESKKDVDKSVISGYNGN